MRYPNPLALAFLAGLFLACSGSESSVTPDAALDLVVQSWGGGSVVCTASSAECSQLTPSAENAMPIRLHIRVLEQTPC